MATPAVASRDVITPEAFRVADHLIGTPLARPSRRLGAILIDLLLVAILVGLLDAIGFLLALAGAFLVFRLSRVREGRWYRRGLGCFGALLTFVALLVAADLIGRLFDDDDEANTTATIETDSGNVAIEGLGLRATAAVLRDGNALRNATTHGARDSLADRIVARLAQEGFTPGQMRTTIADLDTDSVLDPAAIAALDAAVETASARVEGRAPRSPEQIRAADSLATAGLAAAREDSLAAALAEAEGDSALVAARDSMRELRARLAQTNGELARERQQRAAAEERLESGAVRWVMSSISDELGLGLGWLGLYFTAFTVLGGGQTPGKRVFRLRVIRLDGRAIGWWTSLQRFGGYSASVFTGLLGFAEMLWDDNRQALQDKLVHTVVIQEPKKGAAEEAPAVPFAGEETVATDAQEPPALPDAAPRSNGETAPPGNATAASSDDEIG